MNIELFEFNMCKALILHLILGLFLAATCVYAGSKMDLSADASHRAIAQSYVPISIQKNGLVVSKSNIQPDQHILTQTEIQKELEMMKIKMNERIERWGNSLSKKDFQQVDGHFQLNVNKQIEICQIFQSVVNEAFQLAQSNKHHLTLVDQNILNNKKQFIRSLGFENNIVRTQLGFDCLMV
ncbi:hypothetical protein [Acinetobacter shaoyimingii]|uniref:Uncharacterized protein n=1 Tax=Acinetobacter shaoyimingii TaxID=2715164 RepID=A0A6G8RU51_9GAMM|nr:hypothetical protein [Acinetobacter shaoyimingii]QIO05318.1 hypothetical protein G8E00_04755 [Acinetobacter shaoyimingii]